MKTKTILHSEEEDSAYKVGQVFHANWNAKERIVVNQGGSSSSKTYSILQVLFFKAIYEVGARITVVGQDVPNLKGGAYRDAKVIWNNSTFFQSKCNRPNETDRIFKFNNGSFIEFKSYTDEVDARSGKRDYLFLNEANGIDYLIYWQLFIRTSKQCFIDYNPSAKFWVHDNLIGQPDVKLIISDHRHNPFLTNEQHALIENIKDKELWRVYARGLTGNINGLIFPDWQMIPDEKFPDADFFGGLDFGYTNDPTCFVKVCRVGESIFVKELCYTPGLAPIQMKELAEANGFNENTPIYCDHDPEQIAQLRRFGVTALMAKKGQGSVKSGILKLKELKVFYTRSSINLAEELRRYEWIKDKSNGSHTNIPIDKFNHAIDAVRIAVYTQYFRE